MKRATISDVAEQANVSKSTVSQYLNGRYQYMGVETKKGIEEAIQELGYQVNSVARSLKKKRTFTIGVIVANILHTFSNQVIRAIEDVCNEQDVHVIVCNSDDDPNKEKKYIDMLVAKQVDGLITFPNDENVSLYKQMADERYPLIFVDRIVPGIPVDSFLLDNENAAKLTVDHFIEKGHRRIGMIITTSLVRNVTSRIERIDGFKKALRDHGIDPVEEYVKGFEEQKKIQSGLIEMLSLNNPPTALFVGNDMTLMEVLNYAKKSDVKIPDDLAIISVDDVSFAHIYSPTLTTIAQPAFGIGKDAANLLLEKMNNRGICKDFNIHRYKGELIIRESSK